MSRMNLDESPGEVRTRVSCKSLGRLVDSGNMLNELGDSWFSPKYI